MITVSFSLRWHLSLWWCGLVQLLILLTRNLESPVWGVSLMNLNMGSQHCWELRKARLCLWKGARLFTRMTTELKQWLSGTLTFGMFWRATDASLSSDKLPESKGTWSFSILLGFLQSSDRHSGRILVCCPYYLNDGNCCVLFEEIKHIGGILVSNILSLKFHLLNVQLTFLL